jgi:hypothetical protein
MIHVPLNQSVIVGDGLAAALKTRDAHTKTTNGTPVQIDEHVNGLTSPNDFQRPDTTEQAQPVNGCLQYDAKRHLQAKGETLSSPDLPSA